MLQRVLVMAPQASCDTVIDCLQSGKACSSREMAHDLLHDVHLDPSTHSVEKQCIATRNEVDALPLAEFSPQTRPRACSAGLRKGFLSSNAAKPAQQVSHCSFPNACWFDLYFRLGKPLSTILYRAAHLSSKAVMCP